MPSTEDLSKLVYELQTHQIELEIQNEELQRAQVELETSRITYADLYDFAPVGYFTFDTDGLIKEVNLAGAQMLGHNRSLLIDKPFSLFIIAADRDIFRTHLRNTLQSNARQTCEVRLIRKEGSPIYVRMESVGMEKGEGCRSVVGDVSEQKQAEEHIRRLNTELEKKVGELEASNRDWEMFSHAVSHELRTPLFSIDGFSRVLSENYADRLGVKGREHLTTIREAVKQLSQLLEDLSVFFRASAQEIVARPDRIDMNEIARHAYEELKPVIGSRDVQFNVQSLPLCHGDP